MISGDQAIVVRGNVHSSRFHRRGGVVKKKKASVQNRLGKRVPRVVAEKTPGTTDSNNILFLSLTLNVPGRGREEEAARSGKKKSIGEKKKYEKGRRFGK